MNYEYLEERFRKIDVLGNSGKKSTFLAKDTVTGQIVVMKYISKENIRVYQCLMSVRHRNLIPIFFVAEGEKNGLVIMEFISGKMLEDCYGERGRLSEKEALYFVRQLLEGLCVIHKLKLVHRDISPQNVLVSSDGVVKILDFDIGRIVKKGQGCDTELLGTVGYAAPEQFGFSQSDARTDIYGVGVILNVMLTGVFPHEYCYREGKLGEIIQKCIRMEPELRYQSAEKLLREVKSVRVVEEAKGSFGYRVRSIINVLPGFRTGKLWKEILAGYYYISFLSVVAMEVLEAVLGLDTFSETMLDLTAWFLYRLVSALGACNFLHWMDKLPFVRKEDKFLKVVIGAVWWIFFVVIGALMESNIK